MITYIGSPNFTEGREDKQIKKIICHWIVGKLAVADKVFQDTNRNTSAHFGVGGKVIHQYVDIEDTAYHAGKWSVNTESIGIEHEGGPDLPISDETYETSARLIASLCLLYDIPLDRKHILPHSDIVPTQCPGSLNIDWIINEAKEILDSAIIAQPIAQTDQTIIDLGKYGKMEIQQIRGKLGDLERLELDNKGLMAQLSDLSRQLNEARHLISTSDEAYNNLLKDFVKLQENPSVTFSTAYISPNSLTLKELAILIIKKFKKYLPT